MRTKGATSFAEVKLSDLTAKFTADAVIPVSRRFLKINNIESTPIVASTDNLVAAGEQPQVEEVVPVTET